MNPETEMQILTALHGKGAIWIIKGELVKVSLARKYQVLPVGATELLIGDLQSCVKKW